jgi:drug/metabolite transporter (DMT)-like permease
MRAWHTHTAQVASVTILSATSSSWCLVGAFLTGKEQLRPLQPKVVIKCAAVALNLIGVAVVALADETPASVEPGQGGDGPESTVSEGVTDAGGGGEQSTLTEHSAVGDMVAIGSALCYAAYTTMLEHKLGDDADVDMLSLFAFLGAFCVLRYRFCVAMLCAAAADRQDSTRPTGCKQCTSGPIVICL